MQPRLVHVFIEHITCGELAPAQQTGQRVIVNVLLLLLCCCCWCWSAHSFSTSWHCRHKLIVFITLVLVEY